MHNPAYNPFTNTDRNRTNKQIKLIAAPYGMKLATLYSPDWNIASQKGKVDEDARKKAIDALLALPEAKGGYGLTHPKQTITMPKKKRRRNV
jgi:hypothetical protein